MKLKVGDLVAFKKYEDMTDEEQSGIIEENFPEFGKVSEVYKVIDDINRFEIEGEPYTFSTGSIDYIISTDKGKINVGDEVLVKATVRQVIGDHIWISLIRTEDVMKVLKRKEPEYFIVKEDYYGMYIGTELELVIDKSKAKIYTSRDTAVKDAAEMFPYDKWEVIPYGA